MVLRNRPEAFRRLYSISQFVILEWGEKEWKRIGKQWECEATIWARFMSPPHTQTKDSFLISFGPKSDVTLLSLKYVQEMGLFILRKVASFPANGEIELNSWRERHTSLSHINTHAGRGKKKKDVKISPPPPPSSPPLIYDFYPRNIPPPSRPFPTYPTAEKKRGFAAVVFLGGLGGRNIAEFPFQSIPELKGSKNHWGFLFLRKSFVKVASFNFFTLFS